jgi:hypothetical protein
MPVNNLTPALRRAIDEMNTKAHDKLVGLVVRWDERDDLIWTFWSEQGAEANDANPAHDARASCIRYITSEVRDQAAIDECNQAVIKARENYKKKASAVTTANRTGTASADIVSAAELAKTYLQEVETLLAQEKAKKTIQREVVPQYSRGFHAEEVMILSWEGMLNRNGGKPPAKVDLILTKSPCNGSAASSPMDVGTHKLNIGCCAKLSSFIGMAGGKISWNLFYVALAGASVERTKAIAGLKFNLDLVLAMLRKKDDLFPTGKELKEAEKILKEVQKDYEGKMAGLALSQQLAREGMQLMEQSGFQATEQYLG